MEPQKHNEDKVLKTMLQKSRLEMPFSDFEARTMSKIKEEASNNKSIIYNLRLSWLFFCLGTIFGILSAIILIHSDALVFGIKVSSLSTPVYILVGLVFFFQIEQLLGMNLRRKNNL
jgi:ABC-type bacteriocin/lantibiotic exporter with double-glycine peptidase domain